MFNIHQSIFDRYGERDEERVEAYIDDLLEEFAKSPEAQKLLDQDESLGYTGMMLDYAIDYLGHTPPEMSRRDFEEVVFELIPRKVSTEPENGPRIIAELRAFWTFLQRQYALSNAAPILARLNDAAGEELRAALANPANWGMAKSMVMQGMQAGFDMTTEEGNAAFMEAYNRLLLEGGLPELPPLHADDMDMLPLELPNPLSHKARADKRKANKRRRQARKRNRKK